MIAFEVEGIFLSDFICANDDDYSVASRLLPTFSPIFTDFAVITGRPKAFEAQTKSWLGTHGFRPTQIFHDCSTPSEAHSYKLKVLNEHPEITVFIDSDNDVVSYLKSKASQDILHWNTVQQMSLFRSINALCKRGVIHDFR